MCHALGKFRLTVTEVANVRRHVLPVTSAEVPRCQTSLDMLAKPLGLTLLFAARYVRRSLQFRRASPDFATDISHAMSPDMSSEITLAPRVTAMCLGKVEKDNVLSERRPPQFIYYHYCAGTQWQIPEPSANAHNNDKIPQYLDI